jgi:hypothetical protein
MCIYIQEYQYYFCLVFCYYNKIIHKTSEMAWYVPFFGRKKLLSMTHLLAILELFSRQCLVNDLPLSFSGKCLSCFLG